MDEAVERAARAFDDDPFYRWLFPRRRPARLRVLMSLALARCRVHVVDGALVACEVPGHAPRPSRWAGFVGGARLLGGLVLAPGTWARLPTALRVLRRLARLRPREPHVHLEIIAVDAAARGRGLARRLLDALIAEADAGGWPIVLETTNPPNVALYERFGFVVQATVQVGAAPPAWSMLRPRGGGRADIDKPLVDRP